ncbi:putative LRR receptor-like serine/threonine-protein kinase [Camellia lanceoleosa]|uniref:LRR receptor-like serine/threonine-protein kinase n=1 Tax=Camellia lanceoleosa TaxID=1840588 RepID=A0ACC0GPD8_9ERIC|nr:putative LRR receptor-like serine/threonine-protein kinase [Camellia lanceoleosa]
MEIFRDSVLCFLLFLVILPPSIAQLSPSETRILFQIQQILEYPEALQGWKNWTSFYYLPQSPYLVIVCSENHITEFSLVGNRTSPSQSHIPPKPTSGNLFVSQETLSDKFSIGSFFRVLTKLSNLKKEALAVIPPNTNHKGRSKGKLGLILGIVGGVVGAVFAVGLLILLTFRREKTKRKKDDSFECDSFVLEKSSVRSEPAIDGTAHGSDIEAEASTFGQRPRTLHCDMPEPPPQSS